jgi:hypothetical protein
MGANIHFNDKLNLVLFAIAKDYELYTISKMLNVIGENNIDLEQEITYKGKKCTVGKLINSIKHQ